MRVALSVVAGVSALALLAKAFSSKTPEKASCNANPTPEEKRLLGAAESFLGAPYQWGGGHGSNDWGLDCSGLVIQAMRRAQFRLPPCSLPTSDGWWKCLKKTDEPRPGDLALYGSSERAVHVEIVRCFDGNEADTIGANGGDRDVLSPEIAKERGAFVRYASTRGRSNFLGFVRNPLTEKASDIAFADIEIEPDTSLLQEDEA